MGARAGPSGPRLAAAIARVPVGTDIRIACAGQRIVGRFGSAAHDTLRVTDGGSAWRVPLGAVDTMWVLQRGSRRGAQIGAVVGAVGLGVLGGYAGYAVGGSSDVSERSDMIQGAAVGAVVGGAIGALGGGVGGMGLGSLQRYWGRRYP
ncbi:MAG: hypothetical protein ABR499_03680 [Gemmatimonadaceae bacterium]